MEQVQQWLAWVVQEFSLTGVVMSNYAMTGKQLIDLGRDKFLQISPSFVGDIMYEHLYLLRKGMQHTYT